MSINAATKSVRDIFSDYELEIPRYQRKYDWKKDDAAELWNTIIESYDEKTSKPDGPFLGTIILQKDVTGKFAVIDGQQRLTTLTILLIALLKFTAQKKETLRNKNNSEFEIMVSINTNAPDYFMTTLLMVASRCIFMQVMILEICFKIWCEPAGKILKQKNPKLLSLNAHGVRIKRKEES